MYDWSGKMLLYLYQLFRFQLLLKECTIEARRRTLSPLRKKVSVVIERMYDWSRASERRKRFSHEFQLLLKECTIEALADGSEVVLGPDSFSCYWKNVRLKRNTISAKLAPVLFQLLLKECTIEAPQRPFRQRPHLVSVVIERMYDWSSRQRRLKKMMNRFSCYWKNVRLKPDARLQRPEYLGFQLLLKECTIEAFFVPTRLVWDNVSVVIERMYDWSSETNWLKINDFWQLVSGLFFENGRSAQKVPLFSKIWGDCLTVFDSCGNI